MFDPSLSPGENPVGAQSSVFNPDSLKLPLSVAIAATASWTEGDTLPVLSLNLRDGNGPVDLSGTTINLRMWETYVRETILVDTTVTADSDQVSNTGLIVYAWAPGDISQDGDMTIQLRVTWSSTQIATWHLTITVLPSSA